MPIQQLSSIFVVEGASDRFQLDSAIAVSPNGRFVIAWESEASPTDGSDFGVSIRTFESDGSTGFSESRVNAQTTGAQNNASVAGLTNGSATVAFQDASSGTSQIRVAGSFGEILVNSSADSGEAQEDPSITALANGGFVVSWDDSVDGADNSFATKIQIYTADGTEVGNAFTPNFNSNDSQIFSDVAAGVFGRFAVVWQDFSGTLGDNSASSVKLRIYEDDGTTVGGEILVNTETESFQFQGDVAALSSGGFVVVFKDDSNPGGGQIKAQRFTSDGVRLGGEVTISAGFAQADQPAVTGLADGGYAVAFYDGSDIVVRAVDGSDGLGDPFALTSDPASADGLPSIASLANGDFVVSWSTVIAPDDTGVFATVLRNVPASPPPTDIILFGNTVAENSAAGTFVGSALGFDPGDTLTYALFDNANDRFSIDAVSGAITVAPGAVIDFEATPSLTIGVVVFDSIGQSYGELLTIFVADVEENQPRNTYNGTAGADIFAATEGFRWSITGLGGNDALAGAGGDDTIFGGRGNDTLGGGGGNDVFFVGRGEGVDVYTGGDGFDAIVATADGFNLGIASISGVEEIVGAVRIVGSAAANVLDFSGTSLSGVTAIDGGNGADTIFGSDEGDIVFGGAGNDVLNGGGGSDVLTGGTGIDQLTGGAGGDLFTGRAFQLKGDAITDFAAGDGIEITDFGQPASVSLTYTGALLFIDGDGAGVGAPVSLFIGGGYDIGLFEVGANGLGGTLITYGGFGVAPDGLLGLAQGLGDALVLTGTNDLGTGMYMV